MELFLSGRIKFTDIARLVERALQQHQPVARPSLEEILTTDGWAREKVSQLASGDSLC